MKEILSLKEGETCTVTVFFPPMDSEFDLKGVRSVHRDVDCYLIVYDSGEQNYIERSKLGFLKIGAKDE